MNTHPKQPETLVQAIRYFSDADVCEEFVADMRWTDGPVCPNCESKRIGRIETRKMFRCKDCRKQFSVKKGTIFEDSPVSLGDWLCAIWAEVNCKNGCSSYKLARDIGVTQKTAWFMLHRIRLALQKGTIEKKLVGEVEADETFVGGKAKNMHQAKRQRTIKGKAGVNGKVCVVGILERGGEVRTEIVPNVRRRNLDPVVRKHVEKGSELYTDALPSYESLADDFKHDVIDHSKAYVRGKVHTNGIENFWSLVKRSLKGTYISVEPWHLFRYLDEQAFRFNTRKLTDGERFRVALRSIGGKRITYATLTTEVPVV